MTKNSKLFKNIVSICLMVVLLLSSIVSLSFAYFTDKKENTIVINPAIMRTTVVKDNLSPEDLVAGNTFTKNLTITFTGGFDIYFRVYTEVVVETYNDSKVKTERSDLVSLSSVNKCLKGDDNKFYYAFMTSLQSTPVSNTPGTYALTFGLKVDNSVNETMFEDSNFEHDNTLQATVTYHIEYIQKEGYSSWTGYGDGIDAASAVSGISVLNKESSQSSPATFTHTGTLINESNYSTFGAEASQIGKYAVEASVDYYENLFDKTPVRYEGSTKVVNFACNLVEGQKYRITWDSIDDSYINWLKVSNGQGGHNSLQLGASSYTTPISNNYVFTFTKNANIADKTHYIILAINSHVITEGNISLLDSINLKIVQISNYVILDEPLRSIPNTNYADYIDLESKSVVRNVMSLKPTSSTPNIAWNPWNVPQNGTFAFYFSSSILFGNYKTSLENNGAYFVKNVGVCTHFKYGETYGGTKEAFNVIVAAPPYIGVRLTLDTHTIDAAKAWFDAQAEAGTPVEFLIAYYYPKVEKIKLI